MIQFYHVTLSVKDLEASIKFYHDIVGLRVLRRFPARQGGEIAFLGSEDIGGTQVEISGRTEGSVGIRVSIGFVAESLEDTMTFIRKKGYEIDGDIICPNPQTKFFFVKDPDGYRVQFINA